MPASLGIRLRSHDAEVTYGSLAKVSFSTQSVAVGCLKLILPDIGLTKIGFTGV